MLHRARLSFGPRYHESRTMAPLQFAGYGAPSLGMRCRLHALFEACPE
jgi:hypothetical protein